MTKELQLTDAQKKATSAAGLVQNQALLSGAGCGKTFVLSRRFTQLLMQAIADGERNPLARLVALTFTDKAAAEMRQRIRKFLREKLADAGSADDRRMLRGFLEALPDARIATIHSFCAALLRGHAIEAGLDPDFTVASDTIVTGRMEANAAEQAVLAAVESGDAATARLLAGSSFDGLVAEVRRLVGNRERIDLDAVHTPQEVLQQWQDALDAARAAADHRIAESPDFAAAVDHLAAYTCTDPTDKLLPTCESVLAAARQLQQHSMTECPEAVAILADIKTGNAGSKKAWGVPGKEVRDAIRAVGEAISPELIYGAPLNEHDPQAAEAVAVLLDLARDARDRYAAEKRGEGIVDFSDLIIATRRILRQSPHIGKQLESGILQILIDEAQDTDATQVELLLRVLGSEGTVAEVNDGKLFLVGDAKQSIYRFRGAQVEIFEDLCRQLGEDRQIDLATSFRTHPAGIAFVNDLFTTLLGERYSPIDTHRRETPPGPTVEILLAADDEQRATQQRQAAIVAGHIQSILEQGREVWDADAAAWRPVEKRDIAILFSRMTNSGPYERELQKRGLDYYVVAGSGFYRQQEVFDVLNALRVIDNPFDDVAFFGLLRSSMVGLDDNALMHIAETHRPAYLPGLVIDRLGGRLSAGQLGVLDRTVRLVRELHAVKDTFPISEIIERILNATGFEAALLAQWKGRRMAGNVRQLLGQARAADGQLSLAAFIAQMDEFTLNDERYEQASTSGEDEDVVRLMTIHKAKGLEFPVVVVPDLNFSPGGQRSRCLYRLDWGLTTSLKPDLDDEQDFEDDQDEPRSHTIAKILEKRDELQEVLRQYYVALTRHRDYLILVGDNDRVKSGASFRGGESCFLNKLNDRFELCELLGAEPGEATIPYGPGERFQARLAVVDPPSVPYGAGEPTPGTKLLSRATNGDDLGRLLRETTPEPGRLALLGALPVEIGSVELATTALAEFEACPALYRWRYELRGPLWQPTDARTPQPPPREVAGDVSRESESAQPTASEHGLDPLTFGTLLHRCMELLDIHAPASAAALVQQAAADIDLADADVIRAASAQFAPMLERFLATDLADALRQADTIHRELDFTAAAGPATIRGQIDLLYRAEGRWHVVDYKSDHVHGDPNAKLDRYGLQLLTYADAVRRFTGETDAPASVGLYFLRSGDTAAMQIDQPALAGARERIESVARDIIAARRSGQFERCQQPACDFCRQEHLKHVRFASGS